MSILNSIKSSGKSGNTWSQHDMKIVVSCRIDQPEVTRKELEGLLEEIGTKHTDHSISYLLNTKLTKPCPDGSTRINKKGDEVKVRVNLDDDELFRVLGVTSAEELVGYWTRQGEESDSTEEETSEEVDEDVTEESA